MLNYVLFETSAYKNNVKSNYSIVEYSNEDKNC